MGLYNILVGGSSKPRVTELKFKEVLRELKRGGFSDSKIHKVEAIFSGDMYEQVSESHPKGIEKGEIEVRIKWMYVNKSKHGLNDEEIAEVEAALKKRL